MVSKIGSGRTVYARAAATPKIVPTNARIADRETYMASSNGSPDVTVRAPVSGFLLRNLASVVRLPSLESSEVGTRTGH